MIQPTHSIHTSQAARLFVSLTLLHDAQRSTCHSEGILPSSSPSRVYEQFTPLNAISVLAGANKGRAAISPVLWGSDGRGGAGAGAGGGFQG